MADFTLDYDYPLFTDSTYNQQSSLPFPSITDDAKMIPSVVNDDKGCLPPGANDPPPPPPIVICPSEVEHINVTLEKNQQCACKDCGKLFNSVWYLKQHAVKHSNDRPFKCKFCFKTYKFRSNLYQHKCPDRQKNALLGRRGTLRGGPVTAPSMRRIETNQLIRSRIEANMNNDEHNTNQGYQGATSDNEEGDIPLGLCIRIEEPIMIPENPPEEEKEPELPPDCIRKVPMQPEEVDKYITLNKAKLHQCKKCRLHFPSEETLQRHNTGHAMEEAHIHRCPSCPQSFEYSRDLSRHLKTHATIGWNCTECNGCFKSNLALRRHVDQSQPCRFRPFDAPTRVMEAACAPIDVSSFIISPTDLLVPPMEEPKIREIPPNGEKAESGIGSSPESMHSSSRHTEEDEFDENLVAHQKEEEDEGFRSRLNSVTQSCSPGSSSAFSSDGGSPLRKLSQHDASMPFGISAFGSGMVMGTRGGHQTGTGYGQKLFHYEQSVGGDSVVFHGYSDQQSFASSFRSDRYSVELDNPSNVFLDTLSTSHHPLNPKYEAYIDISPSIASQWTSEGGSDGELPWSWREEAPADTVVYECGAAVAWLRRVIPLVFLLVVGTHVSLDEGSHVAATAGQSVDDPLARFSPGSSSPPSDAPGRVPE